MDHIEILFEDNHLLVVVKPPNILVQSDDTGDIDLLTILKAGIAKRHNKKGNVFLGLVHRLDRPVGGVMVFARTSKSASRLSEQIRTHKFSKIYHAIINGTLRPKDKLFDFLKKDCKRNMVSVFKSSKNNRALEQGYKEARLSYTVVAKKQNLNLVKIRLQTGRSHQIRVQFASRHTPLWGDNRYGKGVAGEQIALWATELAFVHPTTKEHLIFTTSFPNHQPWNKF